MPEPTDVEAIRGWLTAPRADTGIHLATDDNGWEYVDYPTLADHARRIARLLTERGTVAGDTVCVLMPTSHLCVATMFAVVAAGATLTPVATPLVQTPDQYRRHLRNILDRSGATVVVTNSMFADTVRQAGAGLPKRPATLVLDAVPNSDPLDTLCAPGPLALLQMTSGSTSLPRGAGIGWSGLAANLAAIDDACAATADARSASWLPLHHDMGLIGMLFQSVTRQRGLHLMRPDQFIRDPARWLRAAAAAGNTATPNFGLAYVSRRLSSADLAGVDLSTLRTVVIGAEPVNPAHLKDFIELTAAHGFSPSALMPAYGLAEHTLIAAVHRPQHRHRFVRIDRSALRPGEPVPVLAAAEDWGGVGSGADWLVSVGEPMAGHDLRIADAAGHSVADGALGEIVLTGPSVFTGYRGGPDGATRRHGAELHSGDAGFCLDGQLYVLGRMGTSLKVNGRTVFAEDVDITVAEELGLAPNRLMTVAVNEGHTPGLALFIETATEVTAAAVAGAVGAARTHVGPDVTLWVIGVPRGGLVRTSSGKPCRAAMWQQWRCGQLAGAELLSVGGPGQRSDLLVKVRALFEKARDLAVIPDSATVHFEGSLAEGFGNQGSDVDFLVLVPGADAEAVMPTVLFIDGYRVEVRVQSHDQIRKRLSRIRAAVDAGSLGGVTEDVLNRVQRFLGGIVLRTGVRYDELRDIVSDSELQGVLARWWRRRATECLRQSAALTLLHADEESADWAREALIQAMKAFLAERGESYIETKWLPTQMERLRGHADSATVALLEKYRSLLDERRRGREHIERALALCNELDCPAIALDPSRVILRRVPAVTTWPIRLTTHVVRDKEELLVLSPECAASWRQVIFGDTLADTRAEPGHLHLFARYGLVALAWRGAGTIKPVAAMCEPNRPLIPPPSRCRPVVTINGAPTDGAIARSPLRARAFAECASALVLANMVLENAREDFAGAVKDAQWLVATLCARRVVTMAIRILASAWGVTPLPADQLLVHYLDDLLPEHQQLTRSARRLGELAIDDQNGALAVQDELDEFVTQVQTLTGGEMFPSSFASREQWHETLRYGYQWLRMGGYLDAYVELDEVRDLLSSGGAQPAARART